MNTTLELAELDRKIGRLFMCGMPGTRVDRETERLIREVHPSGVILFSRNVEDPVQLAGLCRRLQEIALAVHGTPLILAVDQEGGRVARLKSPFTEFPGNESIGRSENPESRAEIFARTTAVEMGLVGLNMDLAPVLDVGRGPLEEHLRGRTFGEEPQRVARLGRIVIRTLQAGGIMAAAKHFPGLGRAAEDPHVRLPEILLEEGELESVNLVPFRAAVEEGVAAVMTSHAVYPSLDAGTPATMSEAVLKGLLRDGLGYDGLIITDDLEMGAIASGWGVPEGAAAAFGAGADLLLVCEDQGVVREAQAAVRSRLLHGEIPMGRLHRSLGRVQRTLDRFLGSLPPVPPEKVASYFSGAA
ncbi:MAG: beta-N-acetylhexosaminidase [Deltaproteobacteria bacterium]|nr:beta-N-acetylhexosaminidase [Deltaproteobacteria bacterium]